MPKSPERKRRLAERLRHLASEETNEKVAAELRRRADLIEAGGDGAGSAPDSSRKRAPPKLA